MSKGESRYRLPSPACLRTFRQRLMAWYAKNGRRFPWRNKSATKYQRIVTEVLLQRTRAETVAAFYRPFFSRYTSWRRLAAATESELRRFIQPIGLWRQRSCALRRLAAEMVARNGRFPEAREEIEALPGVGQYICNAILLLCSGERQPLLDVNMARVLERHFGPRRLADIRYDPYLQQLSALVVDCCDPAWANWAILDLAALVCRQRSPRCSACVLRRSCASAAGTD